MKQLLSFISLCIHCAAGVILVTGCASTRITSQGDSEFGHKSYNKIMVYFGLLDLELRKDAELTLQNKLSQNGVECLPAHQIFFPGRSYSDFETVNIIESNQIDAVLIVDLYDAGSTSTYIPPTTETQTKASISGNYLSGSSTTRTYGGYNINKPWASFAAKLIDIDAGSVVWIASAQTKGNAFANSKTLLRSMANKTADRLLKEKKVSLVKNEAFEESPFKELAKPENETQLPNFRAAMPQANKYNDDEILAFYRKKFPNLIKRSDEELINLIETKYAKHKR